MDDELTIRPLSPTESPAQYERMMFAASDVRVPCVPCPHLVDGDTQTVMNPATAQHIIEEFALAPSDDWLDLHNYAAALYLVHRDLEALSFARRVVALKRNPSTLINLSTILETFGQFDEATILAEEAYLMDPTNEIVGGAYADSLIRFGRWEDAWPLYEKYHTNWDWLGIKGVIKSWQGPHQPLAGKRLLVIDGGGFGDNLIFLRWMERLRQDGAHISYVCPFLLAPLVANHPWIDVVIPNHNYQWSINPRDYDYYVPLLALAARYGVHSPTRLWRGQYVFADARKSALRRMCLDRASGVPRVGICTKAGEGAYPRKYKSLSRDQARRLLHASTPAGIDWVSLQYDEPLPTEDQIPVLEPSIKDWSDTAAIVDNLDLVITVDTGLAHLAGAMNKSVWLMLPGRSSWPFLLGRNDSPFYPSMRIFRNHQEGLDLAVDHVIAAMATYKPGRSK